MSPSRLLSLLLIPLGLSAQAAASDPAWPAVLPTAPQARLDAQAGGIASWTLANGFKIILAPFPAAGSARVELLVKTGSKLEGYGETGMAHLLEHLLFKGAGERADLKRDLTALGARWNGTTSADRTNYFETVAAEPDKIAEAIRIEADRFIRPRFTREDLASEMTVVRNEFERQEREPMPVVMRALQRLSYAWHGYGRPTIGARSDIEGAPFEALQAFHRRHYRPDNAALIVSGQFDPQQVLALAASQFAPAVNPDQPRVSHWTREPAEAATRRSELWLPAGTTLAASAWRLPGWRQREAHALDLASAAVCDPDWGSLRRELVLEQKLAASAYCGVRLQADYGHNPDAIQALVQAIDNMPAEKRMVVISGAGDRRDQDIRDQTKILGQAFDEVLLYQDACQRGREDGEVIALLREGLQGAVRTTHVQDIQGEFNAIDIALSRLSAGDLCLILIDQVEEALAYITEKVKASEA